MKTNKRYETMVFDKAPMLGDMLSGKGLEKGKINVVAAREATGKSVLFYRNLNNFKGGNNNDN